jgi:hypothetical protein
MSVDRSGRVFVLTCQHSSSHRGHADHLFRQQTRVDWLGHSLLAAGGCVTGLNARHWSSADGTVQRVGCLLRQCRGGEGAIVAAVGTVGWLCTSLMHSRGAVARCQRVGHSPSFTPSPSPYIQLTWQQLLAGVRWHVGQDSKGSPVLCLVRWSFNSARECSAWNSSMDWHCVI